MILKNKIITDIIINSVDDLYKLQPFLEDGTLIVMEDKQSKYIREYAKIRNTV